MGTSGRAVAGGDEQGDPGFEQGDDFESEAREKALEEAVFGLRSDALDLTDFSHFSEDAVSSDSAGILFGPRDI